MRSDQAESRLGGRRFLVDVLLACGLVAVSVAPRLASRPRSGFFYDDAWTAVSALHGRPGQVFDLGVNHPGFTAVLMALRPLAEWNPNVLVWPALIAGIVAPALVYLLLRKADISALVALAIASVVVTAPVHVLYSPRPKPFTLDLIVVVAAALLTERVTRFQWRAPIAAAWFVGAIVVSLLSPFALLAVAIAGLTVVLHPVGDLRMRLVAVCGQAIVSALYLWQIQQTYNAKALERFWDRRHDSFIGFSTNPVDLIGDVIAHTGQLVAAFTATSNGIDAAIGLVAIAGLLHSAVVSRSVVGRYLVLLLGAAIVLSIMGKVPYGANKLVGMRVGLWALPVFGFGAAQAVQVVRGRSVGPTGRTRVVGAVAIIVTVAALVIGLARAQPYPWDGSEPAAAFVVAERRPGDVVFLLFTAAFSHAVYGTDEVVVIDAPETLNGLTVVYEDDRLVYGDSRPSDGPEEIVAESSGAERVLVVSGIDVPGGDPVNRVAGALELAGFEQAEYHRFDSSTVSIWEPAVR